MLTYRLTVGLAIIVALLFALYLPLNIERHAVHDLSTGLDAYIPFVPFFVLPYVSYYAFLLLSALLLVIRRDVAQLNRYLLATAMTLATSYLFYGYYQTHIMRPAVDGSGPLIGIVRLVYAADNPYNAFPSLHTSLSTLAALVLWHRVRPYWAFALWGILIVLSTVLVKQHYVLDILSGLALAVLSLVIARYAIPQCNATSAPVRGRSTD